MHGIWKKFGIAMLLSVALLSGCKKKKPQVPPPQAQAPTVTQPQQQQPPVQQQPVTTQPTVQQTQPPVTQPSAQPPVAAKPKPKPKRHVAKKPPEHPKSKTVVKEGSEGPPTGGELSANITPDEASHQRQSTAQLRVTAENNLKNLTRQLSTDEQSMVQQIKTYLAQSRTAEADGDTERAYNLALKAQRLSDDLVKR